MLKHKTWSFARNEVASARVSLRDAVLKVTTFVNSVQYHNIKLNFEFTDLFCEVPVKGQKASVPYVLLVLCCCCC